MEWISVNDRLPDYNTHVLVYEPKYDGGEIRIASLHKNPYDGKIEWLDSNCEYWGIEFNFTHWMPLPQPPDVK